MKIEIDQSGKIESTNRLTVIAFSNSKNKSIIVTSKDKKSIQSIYRRIGKRKLFVYRLFAAMIFYLIEKDVKNITEIIIDAEYPGYENLIKDFIVDVAKKNSFEISRKIIHIKQIGKLSSAHKIALASYQRKKADIKLNVKKFWDIESK